MAPRQRLVPEASSSSSMEDNNNSNGNGNGNGNNGNHRSGSSSPHESLAHQRMVSPRSKHNHQNGNNNNKSYSSNGANQKNGKGIVPHVEDAAAREAHDIFNLIALLFVVQATAVDWDLGLLFQGYGAAASFDGRYFWWTWGVSTAYFLTDLVWVSLVPHCVKSPGTIVKHHLVVIAYLFGPIAFPKYRWFMGACLSVEINTWFLILRRVVYKRKIRVLTDAVSACFYLSWIAIRCFVYPAIMVTFVNLWLQAMRDTNQIWHWPMLFMPVHFCLCLLNLKWSYDLFLPIIKSWFAKGGTTATTVSSGL